MNKARIILGSGSESRRKMLTDVGIAFTQIPPQVDEDAAKSALVRDGLAGESLALALAELKAIEVSARYPDALVIGADQVLICEGRLYNKAEDMAAAREVLKSLRGREHRLISAASIAVDAVRIWHKAETAHMYMREFTEEFLDHYLAAEGEALLSCVGCYRIEGMGAQLFDRIAGDHFAIRGLPMAALMDALRHNRALAQ